MMITERDKEQFPDFTAARAAVIATLRTGDTEVYQELFDALCMAGFYGLASALMTAWTQQTLEVVSP